MQKRIRFYRLLCILLALTTAAACAWSIGGVQRIKDLENRFEALSAETVQPGFDPDAIAASFNGGVVTAAEAAAEYELLAPYYDMLGMTETEYAQDAKMEVLNMLAEEKILVHKAREAGVYELDETALAELEAEVRSVYEENVEYYMSFRFDESKSDAELRRETIEYLAESGYTYEKLLEQAKDEAWRSRLFENATADFTIGDEELRELYEEQLSSAELTYSANYAEYESDCAAGKAVLWHPEGVRRMQMLVVPFDFAQAARYADLQALLAAGDASRLTELDELYGELDDDAQALMQRIQAGESFEALMDVFGWGNPAGECISANSSIFGDAVRDAAMALEKTGDVSAPVRFDEGLCILRYASDVAPGAVPFEQVSEALRSGNTEELRRSRYNAIVMQWIADADVKYYPERF